MYKHLTVASFASLQLADTATTHWAIATGRAFEANPIMASLQISTNLWWFPKLLLVALFAFLVYRMQSAFARRVGVYPSLAIYIAIVLNNLFWCLK